MKVSPVLVILLDEAPDDGREPAPALPPLGPLEDLPGEQLELLVLGQHDRPQVLVDREIVPLLAGWQIQWSRETSNLTRGHSQMTSVDRGREGVGQFLTKGGEVAWIWD